VVWEEEGKYPNFLIELLSPSTASVDRTDKKELYQNRFRTPEYFWFSPDTFEFQGFRLIGDQYEEISPNVNNWRWSEQLGLYLGVEQGVLRYWTEDGNLVLTPAEAAQQAVSVAQEAQSRAEQAELRAEQLAQQLRSLGIEPE
jgi:hypothetical protein